MKMKSNVYLIFSIKKGRFDEAEQSLLRVFGSAYDAKQDVMNISENLQHLRNVTVTLPKFWDLRRIFFGNIDVCLRFKVNSNIVSGKTKKEKVIT